MVIEYKDEELEEKLEALIGGDLISHGKSHFDYKITEDKTYEWVFRNMYQKEIDHFVPDITKEIKSAIEKINQGDRYGDYRISGPVPLIYQRKTQKTL